MSYARWYPTVTMLPDGRVLATSGSGSSPSDIQPIPEIYNPATNSWTALNSASLLRPLYPHIFVLPDGRVIATSSSYGATDTRILDLKTNTWSILDSRVLPGGSAVMYDIGKIMKAGTGSDPDLPPTPSSANTYVLDMSQPAPQWRQTASMRFPRMYHNLTVLPDGTVLVTGGGTTTDPTDHSVAVYEAELWSPATETWSTMARMQTPRLYHSIALLLPDGRVLVSGGGRFDGPENIRPYDEPNAEIYSPPYLFKGPRPVIAGAPAVVGYGSNFTIYTPDSSRIASVSMISLGAVTHAFNQNQRFVPLSFQAGAGFLTAQAPANANVTPPGYYMLFIVDTNGVPSVSTMLRLPVSGADVTPPVAPSSLNAVGLLGSVALSWTAASDNVAVTSDSVFRATTSGFLPLPSNKIATTSNTSYTDTGLAPGNYYYLVTAADAMGNVSAPSNEASATVSPDTTPPSIPMGLAAAFISNTQVSLSWTASVDNSGSVAGYQVFRDGALVGTTATTTFTDTGLSPATTYSYTVAAYDAAANISAPSAPISVTPAATPAGLQAAYSFDEGTGTAAEDSSGNNFSASLVGSPAWVVGKFNTGISLNGSSQWINVGSNRPLLQNVPAATISAWLKLSSLTREAEVISVSKGGSGATSSSRATLYVNPNGSVTVGGRSADTDSLQSVTTPAGAVVAGNWYYLAGVLNFATNRIEVYVNGALSASGNASFTRTATSNTAAASSAIGAEDDGSGLYVNGIVDEVRIYGRALSAGEIVADMNSSLQ